MLHLRDERFGIEFDAPDDSWLAIGPRTGGGGAQVVWIWRSRGGQIDVQALDLSISVGTPPDQATFASKMAEKLRADGARVELKKSTLAGAACEHLVIDRGARPPQDAFMLNRDGVNYAILVTQMSRDAALLNEVRQGFRLRRK